MSLKTIETKIQKILQDGQTKADELNSKIESIQQTEQEAAEECIKAKAAGDPEKYSKAAANQRSAKDIREMYLDKLTALKNAPKVTEEEYQDIKHQIIVEMDLLTQETDQKLQAIIKQLTEIQNDYYQSFTKANDLLHTNQRELRRIPEYEINSAGGRSVTQRNMQDEYKAPTPIGTIDTMLVHSGHKGV